MSICPHQLVPLLYSELSSYESGIVSLTSAPILSGSLSLSDRVFYASGGKGEESIVEGVRGGVKGQWVGSGRGKWVRWSLYSYEFHSLLPTLI